MMHRSSRLRESARGENCVACGAHSDTVVWAHANMQEFGKGMGLKADDAAGMYLCCKCHAELDQGRTMSREEKRAFMFEMVAKSLVRAIRNGVLK